MRIATLSVFICSAALLFGACDKGKKGNEADAVIDDYEKMVDKFIAVGKGKTSAEFEADPEIKKSTAEFTSIRARLTILQPKFTPEQTARFDAIALRAKTEMAHLQ